MHALYDLKEMLCKELEEYGKKGELSPSVLEKVDTLAHAIKNIDKILESYEEDEYSSRSYNSYRGSYRGNSYDGMGSYARGRGSYARRDSRGRYSGEGYSRADFAEQLRGMMNEAPDDRTRQELQRLVSTMEHM